MHRFNEAWALVATVDPVDANNADTDSDEIDMQKYSELAIWIFLGVLNDSATNTVTVKEASASGGSFSAISGKSQAIVGTDDAKQFLIRLRDDELGSGKRYVKTTMDNSAHSQLMAIAVFGKRKYQDQTADDLSTVQTIVD